MYVDGVVFVVLLIAVFFVGMGAGNRAVKNRVNSQILAELNEIEETEEEIENGDADVDELPTAKLVLEYLWKIVNNKKTTGE